MSHRRRGGAAAVLVTVGHVAVGLVAVGLLPGCSGGEDDAEPDPATTSAAPSSARTPPPISPRTTLSFSPGSTLPPSSGGVHVPIPSQPAD